MGAEHLIPWKKGQSGNPSGKTRLPPELRAIRALTQEEACRLISKYARMGAAEVEAILEARTAPMLDLAIAKIFDESVKKGDWQRLSFLLDRAIGRIKITEATDEESEAIREIQDLSDQELIRLVKEKMPEMEKAE